MKAGTQSTPEMISAIAEEIGQLREELLETIRESKNDKVILRRYTIADELHRIAELVARFGDDAV